MASTYERAQESNPFFRVLAMVVLGLVLFLAIFVFLPAGTLHWWNGWLFSLVFLAALVPASIYLWYVNPEIYVARGRIHHGTKGWDKILISFLLPAVTAVFIVAALDDGRFHWSAVPWWARIFGYFLLLVGIALTIWAEAVNKFFEPTVRIQSDRGHVVVDRGPYAFVRHPGYISANLLDVGIALALGSWWALVPAGVACLLLIVRTYWEEATLRAELPGYRDYAMRVRFRWIPGVW